ncbi:MAG: glycoside hydrolase family 38 C-terminal domain-containing protein [Armatimonadota bacterium]
MSFQKKLDILNSKLSHSLKAAVGPIERFRSETEFAAAFAKALGKSEWEALIAEAVEHVEKALASDGGFDPGKVVGEAEQIMAPIGKTAKGYTMHLCGHAHIDMNYLWDWPETVSVARDTFTTVNTLMDEFPDFHFSQSQAALYIAMERYCPKIFEMIKRRVKEGRWEVTASSWVESDRNLVSGESLCRQLLYTRSYFKETFGFEPEHVKIDWSPDTFGQAWSVPSILCRGGISRCYIFRTGPGPCLFKWRSPDGSEITVFHEKDVSYSGDLDTAVIVPLFAKYVSDTGLKDYLYVYGVGDHGGGPTRRDLRKYMEIKDWPIFPTVKLSTYDTYFSAIENAKPDLPVVDADLNFTFEGCYTSQSNIKRANRISEIILPEAETASVIAGAFCDVDYPSENLRTAWRNALFNQFHDVLPGSGIHATYEYSQGLFQDIRAVADNARTNALRELAKQIDTSFVDIGYDGSGLGDGLGAGAGDPVIQGGVSSRGAGSPGAEPIIVYNAKPWPRSEVVFVRVWDKPLKDENVVVRDSGGNEMRGQVIERGWFRHHDFVTIAFKANVPALGYKTYAIYDYMLLGNEEIVHDLPSANDEAKINKYLPEGTESTIIELSDGTIMENEHLRVEIDLATGAIKHMIDKSTGFDYVPEGKLMGLLEICNEAHRGASAWTIGQFTKITPLANGQTKVTQRGPNRVCMKTEHTYGGSRISVEIGLNTDSRMVDFNIESRWAEICTPQTGVTMLRASFPVNVTDGIPTYEIPFGSQRRVQSVQEIPAHKWADLSDEKHGITLVNDCKYGHSCVDDTLRLTLIRTTYDPDPIPEVGDHKIRFGVIAHQGPCDVTQATRASEEFNSYMSIISETVHGGELPSEKSFAQVLTPNVFVSAIKKVEDSDGLVIRLFEVEGKDTEAKIRLSDIIKQGTRAVETDILERPLEKNTAKLEGDILSVYTPKYGQVTVKLS